MGWDDFDGLPVASLPAKFKMPEIERYTGIGCPRIHLRLYSTVMRAHGLDEAQMIMLFPMSLSGATQRWFASLDVSRRRTWDDLAQEFLRQFAFNTVIDVSRRELEALRQRPDETVTSFISRWREKIAQIIDRPSERDQISMIMKSLQPRFARHLMGFPHVDFGSLVQALYGIEEGIARASLCYLAHTEATCSLSQPRAPLAPRPMRQFSQLGMPLSRAFQKLMEGGLLTALAPRPPPQPLPPQFRMDLHCAYHQGPGHDTDRCSSLKHAIQDLIDQGLVNLGQPSVTTNPLPAHTTHSVPPPTGDDDYEIVRATSDSSIPAPFSLIPDRAPLQLIPFTPSYVGHRDMFAPFILWPEDVDVQVMTRSGRIAQTAPPVTRPFGGTDSREEIRVETSTTPEGLIHMMTADRATCIVFSADDLPPEGSDHTRPLYITVVCSGHRVPSVLLDNGSALNVFPLATAIALGFAPSDFGPSTQTVRAYDSTQREVMGTLTIDLLIGPTIFSILFQVLRIPASFNLLLGRPWIHQARAIPSSLHQKVKFIHDGQVITVQSTKDMISSSELVLQISHSDDDFFLTGFTFDEVQTLEIQDFYRDFVAMSFDQHSSILVLDMMRGMSFLLGFGLGRRQHGSSEFVTSIDHETPYGLGFTPSKDDVCYMARLRRTGLADYFVRGSEIQPRIEEIGVDDSTLGELQHVFHQMQLDDETPDMSASAMILPPSPDRASLFSLCFPDETTDYGVIIEPEDMTDGVVPHDEYHDEMDMLGISQFLDIVQCEPFSPLELFGVSVIEITEKDQTVPAPELSAFVIPTIDMYEDTVGPIEGASDSVDPPLSFDILSGFVTRFDCVSDDSVKDLSIYEYSSVSCDDVSLFAPYSITSQIFDINDEIAQPDSGKDSFDHDSDPIDERVSPAIGDVEIVDFGIDDQPRELKIGLPLSTDERNRLIHLLRSYLDVFAWSYEDMPGLDPSIVQHHLPILPHARPVKQKLRRLHPRWSLQKVRVCVDFRNLNKASPKDDFPLPHIDLLVDGTAGHSMVMPFGLKNAGATYQRVATSLFHDMMHRDVEVLRLNPKKCTFGVTSGKLLGHMVSERGIEVDPDKIKAILDMPVPRTEKEIRGFLEPTYIWNDDCQLAFKRIKEYLLSPPVLVPPMPGRPLLLYLSVSDMALGCMLAQLDDSGKERAIYYLSKRMLEYEMRYVMIERFCLALVWATRRLRHYMTEYSVRLISCLDPLRYLFDRPALAGRLMRCVLTIIESRPIDDDFPDEEFVAMTRLSGWRMYFDGAANHSGYGIGVLLVSPQGDHIPRSVRLTFPNYYPTTNNIVEYEACILGLETALELGITQMDVLGDSNLVLRQVQGDWKTRDAKLKPYHAYLELLIEKFEELKYIHLPRAHNQFADALATLASTVDIPTNVVVRPLLIETRSALAYCHLIDETEVQDDLPWFHDIRQFLRFGTYPEAAIAKDRRALRQLATRFVICGETLYRLSVDGYYYYVWIEPLQIE
ncbi:Transposon Tf2-2 polyprotein [Vitis vinifera]|uniref:Transposon Tf2-2 polyprotein n=1 Tax=Vitis vinifera TaxID=29760 RepID=A0A438CPD6_VITVI|nr:Transposon Tf2-2 polyprotein [Vitis vinifera]